MRVTAILAAGALAACQMTAPTPQAPAPSSATPNMGPECTGPNPRNFNGAQLTPQIIAQIPRQFAQDRAILTEILAGRGSEDQIKFATLCHGLKV